MHVDLLLVLHVSSYYVDEDVLFVTILLTLDVDDKKCVRMMLLSLDLDPLMERNNFLLSKANDRIIRLFLRFSRDSSVSNGSKNVFAYYK